MRWTFARGSSLAQLIADLFRILRELLLVFDGDVERALEHLEEIGARYRLWRDDFGPADFRRLLEASGEARPDAAGTLRLTRKGERALRRLWQRSPDLTDEQRAELAHTIHRVVQRLLHRPTVRMRELATGPDGGQYLAVLRELFDLHASPFGLDRAVAIRPEDEGGDGGAPGGEVGA